MQLPSCPLVPQRECARLAALTPATGNAVLGLRLDWATPVAEIPPHLLTHSPASFVGQRRQCLTSGSAATFKGAVVGIERRQHKGMLHVWVSTSTKPASAKSDCSREAFPSAKVRVTASAQARHIPRYDDVDLMVVGTLHHRIHRDGCAPAGAKHAAKLRQAPHGSGKNISPRLHNTASKLSSENDSACPSSTEPKHSARGPDGHAPCRPSRARGQRP